jgi:hypothetical protein
MMDPVTLVLLGAGSPAAVQLTVVLGRWLTLRARADLTHAAGRLPTGTQVRAHDAAGTWSARRTERGR